MHRWLLLAGLLATVAIPFLLGGRGTLAAALNVAPSGYVALLALVLASWIARALKLHLLLHKLRTPATLLRSFGISVASDLAFTATPAGLGGYVATIYYLRRTGASASGATTIMAIDQGTDLVFFGVAVPFVTLMLADSDVPRAITVTALSVLAVASALVAMLWLARRRILALLVTPNPMLAHWALAGRAQSALRSFLVSSRTYLSLIMEAGASFFLEMLALTALQWLTRYAVLWLTLLLLHRPVSFALMFLLQVVVLHAALWTGVPAGGGGAELGLTAMLAHWIAPEDMAAALVIWRAVTLYVLLLAGSVATLLLARMTPRISAVSS
jgi:uncharacterized protein (TIRG00374 family)